LRTLLRYRILFLFQSLFLVSHAQQSSYDQAVYAYISRYGGIAVQEMKQYGIPASITLAQGIIESNAGQSDLAKNANNHFGIKCQKEWTGPTYYQDDDKPHECFRKYSNPLDSYRDHSLFLTTRDRYKSLFSLSPTDYRGWSAGLKAAGYATNPTYADLLIRTIEKYSLQRFDVAPLPLEEVQGLTTDRVMPSDTAGFTYFAPGPGGRRVFLNNHVLLVVAGPGETLASIGIAFGIPVYRLIRYNDLPAGGKTVEGQIVYLAKKQRKGAVKTHSVVPGQTLWEISQIFGVRLSTLCKRNHLDPALNPPAGTVLKLR
jgi:LysM repeat protein